MYTYINAFNIHTTTISNKQTQKLTNLKIILKNMALNKCKKTKQPSVKRIITIKIKLSVKRLTTIKIQHKAEF